MRWVALTLGFIAILALLGVLRILPPVVSFFVGSLAILLFPGIIVACLLGGTRIYLPTLPERLAVWLVTGIGIVSLLGFAGLVLHARLSHLTFLLGAGYAAGAVFLFMRKDVLRSSEHSSPARRDHSSRYLVSVVFGLAAVAALLTLLTPRDGDDWYYLAHIADYTANHPLRMEDTVFGEGLRASPREWFGAWWVVEALLSRSTGTDPVAGHQVHLPVLIVGFTVFAVFTLCRRVLPSLRLAVLACCFQVLFYVSSVFPHKSAGWMLFCRASQDKAVASLLMVPVAVALAVGFLSPRRKGAVPLKRGLYWLYCIALISSTLVHPQGIVWCGVAIIPFALVELLRERSSGSARRLVMIILPFLVCGLFLLSGHGVLETSLEVLQVLQKPAVETGAVFSLHLPGKPFPPEGLLPALLGKPPETSGIASLLYITRYPLALAGLVLTLVLIPGLKSSFGARFLICVTASVLILAYTPFGAGVAARLMSWKMLYRLTWVLPWGLTIVMGLSLMRLRPVWMWVVLIIAMFVLARGNPHNYVKPLSALRENNRPPEQMVEVLRALRSRPAPQGRVLTSEGTGRFIAAFVPEAYPATYRGFGALQADRVSEILGMHQPDEASVLEIAEKRFGYMLFKKDLPLAGALRRGWTNARLLFENDSYSLWSVPSDFCRVIPSRPGPNLLLVTITSLRRDHLGAYGYDQKTSPNIDAVARQSVLFENAVSQSSQTLSSHASVLTGMNVRKHKALNDDGTLNPEITMLPELLSEQYYLTGAFVSDHALSISSGLARGFDTYWSLFDQFPIQQIVSTRDKERDLTTDAALSWLRNYKESPFFLWLQWSHPHRPYNPPDRYLAASTNEAGGEGSSGQEFTQGARTKRQDLSRAQVDHLIERYDGEIAFADVQVGRVIEELDSLGLLDDIVVIITADHGEILYEHESYFGHEAALYDGAIMIPLIMHLPSASVSVSRVEQLVRSIDILPTILSLFGLDPPGGVEGRSLLPLLKGSDTPVAAYAFAETFPASENSTPQHAVRTLEHSLIWRETPHGEIVKEFYDLVADPHETVNIYSPDLNTAAHLDTVLSGWMKEEGLHPATIPQVKRGRRWGVLRRMGYID